MESSANPPRGCSRSSDGACPTPKRCRVPGAAILTIVTIAMALAAQATGDARSPRLVRLAQTAHQPEFLVSAQPQEGSPGSPVSVSFSSLDPGISITGCSASFVDGTAI